jgi:UDP-N-acetylmuramate-alanine ligase
MVIDDFAHSPVKIAAALEAVSGEFETFNVVWRPHGFTPLAQGLDGFIEVFKRRSGVPTAFQSGSNNAFAKLFILPVYYAGGTVEKKITAKQFVQKLQAAGVPTELVQSFKTLELRLLEENRPVLLMGARDPELPEFAHRIATKLEKHP